MANAKLITAIILIVVVVLNVILFAFRVYDSLGALGVGLFWIVLGIAALITYVMFPKKS